MAANESEHSQNDPAGDDPQAEAQEAGADHEGAADDNSPPTIESLTADLEQAATALTTAKDQALRAAAEAENVRRRATRDVENAHKFALERFTGDLLPVVDGFERAQETAEQAAKEAAESGEGGEHVGAIAEGVALSVKLLAEALGKHGITQVNPVGEPFDPTFHEAMSMVENPDAEPGSVLFVVQRGYVLNDRLVRPARVVVAKAPDDAGA